MRTGKVMRFCIPVIIISSAALILTAFFPGRGKEHEAEHVYRGSIAGAINDMARSLRSTMSRTMKEMPSRLPLAGRKARTQAKVR